GPPFTFAGAGAVCVDAVAGAVGAFGSVTGAAGVRCRGAAGGGAVAPVASPKLTSGWPTLTVCPGCTWIFSTRPAKGEGISTCALSVSTSSSGASSLTRSPSLTRRVRISASTSPSPRSGRTNVRDINVRLEPIERRHRALVHHVAGVERGLGLEEEHVDLVGERPRAVLHAVGHHDEFAGPDLAIAVAELHAEPSCHHEEELVLAIVVMPDELPGKLDELHLHVVHLAHDLGRPVLGEARQLLHQIDHIRGALPPGDDQYASVSRAAASTC